MKARPGPLTYATILLLAAFSLVDLSAHMTRYQYGETFSRAVEHLCAHRPLLQGSVVAFFAYLGGHLAFGWPL